MRLHKAPLGLLGAFDLKALGRQPNEFAETLLPVTDVTDFYLQPNAVVRTAAAATGALGATLVNLTPAQNEVWRVKGVSIVVARAAADAALSLEFVLGLNRAGGGGIALFSPRFDPVPATDLTQARAFWLPRTLLLGPGDVLRLVQRSTMAAGTAGATADIDLLPV